MRISHIVIPSLAFTVCAQVNANAQASALTQALPPEQVAHYQLVCDEGLYSHERRLFDALAHSDLIDWTLIEPGTKTSRINYTRTADADHKDVVHCDAVVEYTYDKKQVAIKTGYSVNPQHEQVMSDIRALNQAIRDFIIQLMV
ncbi:hypothetical protein BCU70_11990 [Vibrio sp. 10N.286.49.C2]|uniref:hypothetical protein n=1 Tax=unclassified Vibrio TaxID=2614977 RepID=UPI000C836A1E|nr:MULTISPECIES: hypothetical protein [unclassified Vibrio]PMH40062.1 hypothetical protein BCU70_11990 [Vibrio sp. 10N.286.49.C2]PMH52163.1 hypothetical protein BCU66_16265 [Vibrio sp. 10N.286.49.B1]PMH78997.1 hypothetical protein BCU58_07160 [Vibrio sp. 10N.286.48.B7]